MDFRKTDEQELLLESLRELFSREDWESYYQQCDQKKEFPQRAVDLVVDAGFTKLGIPEESGGVETDTLTLCMVAEQASALGFPAGAFIWPCYITEIDVMAAFGTKEQQETVLKYAMQGIRPFSQGFSEPQAGSDSNAIATTATRRNGKVYINGHKTFNSGGDRAPYMLCVVRDYKSDKPSKDMSMWFVPLDAPGVTVKPLNKIGNNVMNCCEVYLEDVEIEEKDLVGVEGQGFVQLMKNMEVERLFATAHNLGMACAAYEDASKYAAQRIQFGQPIGSFQLIQEKLCNMKIKIESMRHWIYQTAWKHDNGMSISTDAALTKVFTGRTAFEVIDDAMQIMGGIGYTHDCRISRMWRDQRVLRIGAGSDEIMIHVAGRALVKEASK